MGTHQWDGVLSDVGAGGVCLMDDHDLLIRIDEKMDACLTWQKEHKEACHTAHMGYEKDLAELKAWKYKEAGGLMVITLLLNVMGKWLMHWWEPR